MKCFEDIVSIGTVYNEKFLKKTTKKQGFNTRVTILTRKYALHRYDLINQLNRAMDDLSYKTVSSKYCELCEPSSLMNNSKNYLSFFHLNISPLSFRIEDLRTLISEHHLTFEKTYSRMDKVKFVEDGL